MLKHTLQHTLQHTMHRRNALHVRFRTEKILTFRIRRYQNKKKDLRTLEESRMTFRESTVVPCGRPGDMDLGGNTPRVRDSQKHEIGKIEMGYGTRS